MQITQPPAFVKHKSYLWGTTFAMK